MSLLMQSCAEKQVTVSKPQMVYVGTYTQHLGFVHGKAHGIYVCHFDTATGKLTVVDSTLHDIANPSFLTISPNKQYLYAVSENAAQSPLDYGKVAAYKIGENGKLLKINEVSSQGGAPCHVSVDNSEKFVLITNYVTGNVVSFRVKPDGGLSDAIHVQQNKGPTISTKFGWWTRARIKFSITD
jgi:6-phosphogluconolactonase